MKRKSEQRPQGRGQSRREARATLAHLLAHLDRETRARLTRPRVRIVRGVEAR